MKKKIFLLVALIFILGQVCAQVTIGSGIQPNKGSLLDLKQNDETGENSKKGLALSKVQLTTISSLDDIAPSLDKNKHIGLTIYVPEAFENSCPGIYVWSGLEWEGLDTDVSKAPEYVTVDDIDGNKYTAKIFNRKGCTGGVYWFTSNLRTTRKNDGTPFHRPLYYNSAQALNVEEPFDENNIVNLHQVRSKADISTSTASNKMLTFYQNNIKVQMSQDAFVTKFGLQYTYYMAMPRDGETDEDVKICPEGWKVPLLSDWVNLLNDVTGIPGNNAASVGTPYLFGSNDLYESDGREIYDEQGDENGEISYNSWRIYKPTNMGGFPVGDPKNSGLNIYPASLIRVNYLTNSTLDASFGFWAFFLEKGNGAISMRTDRQNIAGSSLPAYKEEVEYGSVRCIKVVE